MIEMKTGTLSNAVRRAYEKGIDDEMLEPLVLTDENGSPKGRFHNGDAVIFYNIRGEREIELTRSFTEKDFREFPVSRDLALHFATMIEYRKGLQVAVGFPPEGPVEDTLSVVLAKAGKHQVKITEAEKAVHLGYFFNGKQFRPEQGEERIVIPTRKDVVLFDEAPEMSIAAITETVLQTLEDVGNDCIVVNFPNVDVVGHTENREAIIAAVEAVDNALGVVVDAALSRDVTTIVTADHGTVEKWLYPDGKIDTGHTDSPVPFIIVSDRDQPRLSSRGELADVAPTLLDLMGIEKPEVMTGMSLLSGECEKRKRILLLILDGWGLHREGPGNLISQAHTAVMDRLWNSCPSTSLDAAGRAVGLPSGTVGNSEVGHLHIGAGRRIYSDRVKINRTIDDGSFFSNRAFNEVIEKSLQRGSALHLMGIVSFFSSHGSVDHLFALMDLAKRREVKDIFVHAMLGRRGEKPESGALYIEKIEKRCRALQVGSVVSVIGRYWSMDREENWDRIEKTYRMLVYGEGAGIPERG